MYLLLVEVLVVSSRNDTSVVVCVSVVREILRVSLGSLS